MDLADPGTDWRAVLAGADVVVNLAGFAHDIRGRTQEQAEEYMAVNAHGAARVASAAASDGARSFIQISTIKVLGETPRDGFRFREDDPLAPVGVYAESKALGEEWQQRWPTPGLHPWLFACPLCSERPSRETWRSWRRRFVMVFPFRSGIGPSAPGRYIQVADLMNLILTVVQHPGHLPPVLHARSTPDLTAAEVASLVGKEIGRQPRIVSGAGGHLSASPGWLASRNRLEDLRPDAGLG